MIDTLMHDYGLSLFDAMHRFPLAAALSLWPARAERNGDEETGADWAAAAVDATP